MIKFKSVNFLIGALVVTSSFTYFSNNSFAQDNKLFEEKTTKEITKLKEKYSINWSSELGKEKEDKYYDVIKLSDDSLIAVGQSSLSQTTGFTSGDGIIVKYDKTGEEVWKKELKGDETDRYYSAIELNDGSIIALGISYSTDLGFENSSKVGNAIISKYSSEGNIEWTKNFKEGSTPLVFKNAIALSDGGFIAIKGKIESNIGGDSIEKDDIATHSFVKFSNDGSQTWEKKYTESDKKFVALDIVKSSDDNIFVSGYTYQKENKDDKKYVLAKLGLETNKVWSIEDSSKNISLINSIIESSDGKLYAVGEFSTSSKKGNINAFISSVDTSNGSLNWTKNVEGEGFDSFKNVLINSKNEIIVVGHSNSKLRGTTIDGKTEAIIVKYDNTGLMSEIANLGKDTQGLVVHSAVVGKDDKLILAGKQGKDPEGIACDLINPCVQFDAVILSVEEKIEAPVVCEVNAPELVGEDITITVGDMINPKDYVEIKDPTLEELNKLITFKTNLKGEGEKYYSDKPGEYFIEYEVENECGIGDYLKIKVNVKEDPCATKMPEIIGNDEYTYYPGNKFYIFDLVTVEGIDSSKIKDTKVENIKGKNLLTLVYESGHTLSALSDIKFETPGKYSVEFIAKNECGEAKKTVSVTVKGDVENTNSPTEKPQTGDNTLVYAGLVVLSIVGLVAINKKDKANTENKEDNQE